MLKLIKYEFRKALTAMLVLLGITAGIEAYFLIAMHMENAMHLMISIVMLMCCTYAVAIYVFIRGVTTYSAEMKNRSAYLIFMTPNSGLKIMGSKYLYTFVNGVLFAGVYALLAYLDIVMILKEAGEYESFAAELNEFLLSYGLHMDQLGLAVLIIVLDIFLSLLSFFAIAYLAITLSHTLFRDKKWRGAAALGIFFLLNWGVRELTGLLPSAIDELVIYENAATIQITTQYGLTKTATLNDILTAMLPAMGVSLATILISLFGCAWMLDKKVSL
ncbi:MAG: hypothetical protein IJZ74_12240 [Clostridia bacterium]|nr:hypothetical protein [Clostridia bacterium]